MTHTPVFRPALVLLAALLPALPLPAQKSPAVRLNTPRAGSTFAFVPQICCAGDNVYVVWTDTRNSLPDVFFNRSTDRGATWLASDIRLDTDPAGRALSATPRIACRGNTVYVVWSDFRNGGSRFADVYLNVSTDAGATWRASDVRVNTDPLGNAAARCPVVSVDAQGVYVAWLDDRNGNNDVYFNRSLDGGATWLAGDVRLDTDPPGAGESTCPDMCSTGGNVYVGWNDSRNGATDIYFNRSIDRGATWLASDVRVDTNAPGASASSDVALACAGNNVYFAWWDARNGDDDIYFNRSTDRGATWMASDVRIDTDPPGAALSNWPDICCDGDTVYLVWEDWRNGILANNADVYFSRSTDAGATWLASDVLVSHGNVPSDGPLDHVPAFPQIGCQGRNVYVAWSDIRAGFPDIYTNRSTDGGITWLSQDVPIDGEPLGASNAAAPEICVSDEGVYVTWQDSRHGALDIYFNIPLGRQPYGAGTAGAGGMVPRLSGDGTATLGSTFAVHATQALGQAPAAVMVGTSRVSTPVLGGTLLVSPVLGVTIALGGAAGVPGAGSGKLVVRLPTDEAFLGTAVFFQVLILDGGAPAGVAMTNGVELWIG